MSGLALLSRRALMGCASPLMATICAGKVGWAAGTTPGTTVANINEWALFKARFLAPDGRIVDTGNGGVSHSEGQGWGLFFAVTFDDRSVFARILDWTDRNLRCRDDSLLAWRYVPWGAPVVADRNNATDGDIFVAASLAMAARAWDNSAYASMARIMTQDILRHLVRKVGQRTLLLPGAIGFETDESVTVNPSYYAFPVIQELADLEPSPVWRELQADGLAIISEGRFGNWMLPPDWLRVPRRSGPISPAPDRPPQFSYDAVRIPLYLAWAGIRLPAVREALVRYWSSFAPSRIPAWVDLETNQQAPYAAPQGITAIAKLTLHDAGLDESPERLPSVATAPDYYSAALTLLARAAWPNSGRTGQYSDKITRVGHSNSS